MESPGRKSSRRDFLRGKSALNALEQGCEALASEQTPEQAPVGAPAGRGYLFQISRTAMACQFQVYLNAEQNQDAPDAAVRVLDLVQELEQQMTVYRDDSEISLLNQRAVEEPVAVEARLYQLLEQAVSLAVETEGAFDITASPLGRVWGFHRRQGQFPSQADLDKALEQVGSRWLELDDDQRSIRFLRPGIEINLGAIGKGYALDRCAEQFLDEGVGDFLVHGGQSSVIAHGTRAGRNEDERGWTVAIQHPLRGGKRLAEVRLRDQALGTSGSGNQFFYHKGRRYGHVLDPRTGRPAEGVLSSTILAPSAALADALSTASFVLGAERTRQLCQQDDRLAALLVCPGPRSGSIEVSAVGLDDADWRLLSE